MVIGRNQVPLEEEILELSQQWNAALQTGDPDEVVKLYADNAILEPTVSNLVRHNPAEIRDYFVHFLAMRPSGTIDEANVRIYGGIAINSGVYTFHFRSGPVETVQARFTFVYQWIGGRWLIVEHHSSAMPEH
jgi:uncharacterized protein (TIGR02246 family)